MAVGRLLSFWGNPFSGAIWCYVSCWYRAVAPLYFPTKQMPEWWRSLYLHTCDMLRNCRGAGVGWVGDDGGVGWGWWRSLHLHTCDMLRNCWGGGVGWGGDDVLCTCTHLTCYATAGVGWGWWRSLHLHTCDMLRNCWGGGVGWVGDDDVLCTCTHVTCYATAGVVGWGGLGMMTFFALAHMWHATQLLGWWGGMQ